MECPLTTEELIDRCREEARRQAGDDHDIDWEDLMQNSLELCLRVPSWDHIEYPHGYISRIVKRAAQLMRVENMERSPQYTYKTSIIPVLLDQVLSGTDIDGPGDMLDIVACRADLKAAMRTLRPGQLELIYRRYCTTEQLTVAERGKLRRVCRHIAWKMNAYRGQPVVGSRRAISNRQAYYRLQHQDNR